MEKKTKRLKVVWLPGPTKEEQLVRFMKLFAHRSEEEKHRLKTRLEETLVDAPPQPYYEGGPDHIQETL